MGTSTNRVPTDLSRSQSTNHVRRRFSIVSEPDSSIGDPQRSRGRIGGVRFSFVQEYFNLLCSDLSSLPVASCCATIPRPSVYCPIWNPIGDKASVRFAIQV
jgi:hypothetical protein